MREIDAGQLHYKDLNSFVRRAVEKGEERIVLANVNGHRYIGGGLRCERPMTIDVHGVAGNDLASFMNGPITIRVHGNAQDAAGNTMNEGTILIEGDAGDVLGYGMRGGRLYVRGNAGYRVAIHMKEYGERHPIVVIGNVVQAFLGEYMAGGTLVVLGLDLASGAPLCGRNLATGMHGGRIFLRGEPPVRPGPETRLDELDDEDWGRLEPVLEDFRVRMNLPAVSFSRSEFVILEPVSARPYGNVYAY
ncbi:MAG: hypothetical protein V2A58_11665 [Planctomycetota bacterium]